MQGLKQPHGRQGHRIHVAETTERQQCTLLNTVTTALGHSSGLFPTALDEPVDITIASPDLYDVLTLSPPLLTISRNC